MNKQNINQENLEFTEQAKQIATLMASILHEAEPNNVKIQIIKEELNAGRYQINNQQIVKKLLEYAPVHEENLEAILL